MILQKMSFDSKLCYKLIEPLIKKAVITDHNIFGIDNDSWVLTQRYQHTGDLMNYIMSGDKINASYFRYWHVELFDKYVKHISKLPLPEPDNVEIDEAIIRYAIINEITLKRGDGKQTKGEKFIKLISNDKVVDDHLILNIAFEYIEYMRGYPIIEMLLPKCKLTPEQMDLFVKHYKNGDIYKINHFVHWGLPPSEKQIHMLISNKNSFDENFIKEFNVEINANYVIANIKAGNQKIIGVNPKQKWKFDENQKKELNVCIFENAFTKAQVESMRKLYGLTYDVSSLLSLCKNSGSIPVFNYLVDLGIEPTVECLYHIIPKHCSHSRIHDLLSKSVRAKVD